MGGGNIPEDSHLAIMGISGGPVPLTILKVRGKVSGIPVTILLDSESTHNFLHPRLVAKANLQLYSYETFKVRLGMGIQSISLGKWPQVPILVHGLLQQIDFYVPPLGIYDVVLEGMWFKSLNDIIWNFDRLTIKLQLNRKEYLFKGLPFDNLKIVDGKELNHDLRTITEGHLIQWMNMEGMAYNSGFQLQKTMEPALARLL